MKKVSYPWGQIKEPISLLKPTCNHILDEVSVSRGINYGDVIF